MVKNIINFHVFSPLEFIAAITQHIPEPPFSLCDIIVGIVTVCVVAEGTLEGREEEKQSQVNGEIKIIDIRNDKPKCIPQLMLRECIKKSEDSRSSLTCGS